MSSHPTKKQRLEDDNESVNDVASATMENLLASFGALSVDVLADIFGFLPIIDTMRSRRINKKTMEAVRKTIAPLITFCVENVEGYNAINVMTRALPNLQLITIYPLGDDGHKWSDGEDPHEAARTANLTTHDITIISNFSKLRGLGIIAPLNGRYPFLFNSFPLLEKLLINCSYLKWDLETLAGFPVLKELKCWHGSYLTGNINSLRVLKHSLEKVYIDGCPNVEGNFMDLADFPHLKELDLEYTAVTGDIRDIGRNDLSSLEELVLPKGVYGGAGYELQRISDAPDLMRSLYLFGKQRPTISLFKIWFGKLSEDSPDWYERRWDQDFNDPPLSIHFVQAGSRVGYRWSSWGDSPCEVNWLDPEPNGQSSDYDEYIEEFQEIERQVKMYRGFNQPPTEEEYNRLERRRLEDEESDSESFDSET